MVCANAHTINIDNSMCRKEQSARWQRQSAALDCTYRLRVEDRNVGHVTLAFEVGGLQASDFGGRILGFRI